MICFADFTVDLSFNQTDVEGMLEEYEQDHHTGMNIPEIAGYLIDYTYGYPYLVSKICKLLDEDQSIPDPAWNKQGVDEAVKRILSENNSLFSSLTAKLNNYPTFKETLRKVLMEGPHIPFNPDQEEISQMVMYGLHC